MGPASKRPSGGEARPVFALAIWSKIRECSSLTIVFYLYPVDDAVVQGGELVPAYPVRACSDGEDHHPNLKGWCEFCGNVWPCPWSDSITPGRGWAPRSRVRALGPAVKTFAVHKASANCYANRTPVAETAVQNPIRHCQYSL